MTLDEKRSRSSQERGFPFLPVVNNKTGLLQHSLVFYAVSIRRLAPHIAVNFRLLLNAALRAVSNQNALILCPVGRFAHTAFAFVGGVVVIAADNGHKNPEMAKFPDPGPERLTCAADNTLLGHDYHVKRPLSPPGGRHEVAQVRPLCGWQGAAVPLIRVGADMCPPLALDKRRRLLACVRGAEALFLILRADP
ncbi:hypothetical protein RM779_06720 [Streptomyces sp. DSM 41886]|uniref:Uncharacterized protein n=1 Tax=Streptomyces johnsoniae TaxID=3075532 RepID=A0ABU2S3A0_9ACTN|nr:hypothetical protein [Streptomyces sp. DSM 41886]MDT0442289.1 hypothetical protein [Streptomyces sp. DSM 41886]